MTGKLPTDSAEEAEKYYLCNKPCADLLKSWVAARSEIMSAEVDIANVEMDISSYNSPEAQALKPGLVAEIKSLENAANKIRQQIIDSKCRVYDTCPK
jgi:hypothetical protein